MVSPLISFPPLPSRRNSLLDHALESLSPNEVLTIRVDRHSHVVTRAPSAPCRPARVQSSPWIRGRNFDGAGDSVGTPGGGSTHRCQGISSRGRRGLERYGEDGSEFLFFFAAIVAHRRVERSARGGDPLVVILGLTIVCARSSANRCDRNPPNPQFPSSPRVPSTSDVNSLRQERTERQVAQRTLPSSIAQPLAPESQTRNLPLLRRLLSPRSP